MQNIFSRFTVFVLFLANTQFNARAEENSDGVIRTVNSKLDYSTKIICSSNSDWMNEVSVQIESGTSIANNSAITFKNREGFYQTFENVRWSDQGSTYTGDAYFKDPAVQITARIDKTTRVGKFKIVGEPWLHAGEGEFNCSDLTNIGQFKTDNRPTEAYLYYDGLNCLSSTGAKFSVRTPFLAGYSGKHPYPVLIVTDLGILAGVDLDPIGTFNFSGKITGQLVNSGSKLSGNLMLEGVSIGAVTCNEAEAQ